MKKITNFIKDFLLLREEDKIHMLPWEMIKSIFSTPTAYKYKGTMLIPQDKRWNWRRTDKAPSGKRDGKSPVNQSK